MNTDALASEHRLYARHLLEDVHATQEIINKKIVDSKLKQKSIHDRSCYRENMVPGSRVIKRVINGFGSGEKFTGPITIVELDSKKAKIR